MFINNDERTGRFTFEAEGSLDPHSPWYIGKLSHPSAQSGVTVGAGYDMGGRTPMQVRNELVTAGCNSVLAEKLSRGAGLRGHPADQFVKANKSILAINEVQVLRNLFAQIYPTYVAIAQKRFQFHSHSFEHAMKGYGKTFEGATYYAWEELYPSIRVMAVDFTYQGFGKQRPLHFCMANDFQWLIDYIKHTPGLNQYEKGRHRAEYLRKNKAFEQQAYSQCAVR